ncbi:GumC family protein [Yoonia algicola]|uniref:Wzz/FepE/Etk N-terminal domain-containing protein n=1 Tax=Yoonia algicola TaxID=3137368 RepID=A0AAN0LZ88_9RHOB
MTQRVDTTRPDPHHRYRDIIEPIAPLDIAAMLRVLWHGKWLVLCVLLFTTGVAGYYAFRMAAPQYVAGATLQLGGADDATSVSVAQPSSDDAALNTAAALVTSDPVLTRVITALDLLADPEFNRYLSPTRPLTRNALRTQARHWLAGTTAEPPDDAAVLDKTIQNLRHALTVTRQPDTYILHITAQSRDPDKAVTLANTTAALYLSYREATQVQKRAETEVWLQSRVNDLRAQLEQQEKEAAAIIASAQIQGDSALDALTTQVLAADQDLSEARNALRALEIGPDNGSARNNAEIAHLRSKINDLTALKDRRSAQLSAQSAGQAALHQIELQAEATRLVYQGFLAQLQENRMQQGLGTTVAQRIAPATEGKYAGPQKMLILTVAVLLGGVLGIIAVAIRHTARKGIVDARSLHDATGLPVLAQFSSRTLRQLEKNTRTPPVLFGKGLSQAGRRLHTSLALTSQGSNAQVIVSTSSIAAEGKTHHALFLTQTLGMAGKRVALIGADTPNPMLRSVIGADPFQAAQQSWASGEPATHCTNLGADILIISDIADQHAPLLSDQLAGRLNSLRQSYDHIIIDAPPVLLAPEARLFARHSDAIIYAVRWSRTPRDAVQRGLEALDDIGHPATGVILSRINLRKMRQLSNDPCLSVLPSAQTI